MEKIIIGVPIRDFKSYSIEDWLISIKNLEYDNYLLYMVDNSDNKDFFQEVLRLCQIIDIKKFEIIHLENMENLESENRLAQSREKIREKILHDDFDLWFSLECDIIAPPDTLFVMRKYLNEFDVVNHTYPSRENINDEVGGMGCSLYKKKVVENFSFIDKKGYGQCDELNKSCYYSNDSWFFKNILRSKYTVADIHNVIDLKHKAL